MRFIKCIKCILFVLLTLNSFFAFSQDYNFVPSRKAKKLYSQAQKDYSLFNFKSAVNNLEKAIEIEPEYRDVYLFLADLQVEFNDYCEAAKNISKALEIYNNPKEKLLMRIGLLYNACGDYVQSSNYINKYFQTNLPIGAEKEYLDSILKVNATAIELQNKTYTISLNNLGDSVNSPQNEYVTTISSSETEIYFTRRFVDTVSMGGILYPKTIKEIPYIAFKNQDTELWDKVVQIADTFPNLAGISAVSVSPDGNYMFYSGCNFPNGFGSCDIYCSIRTENGWSNPINLGKNVNTKYWESQPYMSSDGVTLFFVSNRPDGFGGSDIWYTKLLEDGTFSKAKNLGDRINTNKDEFSPFIHFNANTLYFTSDGYKGIGGLDIYKVNLLDKNSKPQNLGAPINNKLDQQCFIVNPNGNLGYVSSQSPNGTDLDIYSFELPEEIKPEPVDCYAGVILDAKTKLPIENASVQLFGLNNIKSSTNTSTNTSTNPYNNISSSNNNSYLNDTSNYVVKYSINTPVDGRFYMCFEQGLDIGISVLKKNYFLYSNIINSDDIKSTQIIYLMPIEDGGSFVAKNINFEVDSYVLNNASYLEINRIYDMLINNPEVSLEISGHTDNTGTDEYNVILSQNRAETVMESLINKGISPSRLSAKGYGATKPIASNETEEGRRENRRTEFIITIE